MIDSVDPFIGTGATDLAAPSGLAATWWWPKPQVGNTHPGAVAPFGMVSAGAYSGAYPTGYGIHQLSTEGVPRVLRDRLEASGFTHFQQSGTGAIRRYYNYVRVTPMLEPLDALGTSWELTDEVADPGYYATTLGSRIRCEVTVGPKSAVHRYSFPAHHDARLVVDLSQGGLDIDHGRTLPLRAHLQMVAPGVAQGEIVVEGVPLAVHIECDSPEFRQMLWYDRRLMPGSTRLDFDYIRPTTLRPFGLLLQGPTTPGQAVELRIGFSLRGVEQAAANLRRDAGESNGDRIASLEAADHGWFDTQRSATRRAWRSELGAIRLQGVSGERREVFATALYHSLIKPCFARDESPYWSADGPWVFDLSTMWDIYRTQLPLLTALDPGRAVELAVALLTICEREGNLPIGYRMARGADRFSRQASALAHTLLADLCELGIGGVDWEWALVHMHGDLRRNAGEEFLERGIVHPISHHLDVTYGYHCTAKVARALGDDVLAAEFEQLAASWTAAFDETDGLLVDSTFYEGGKWNYSFRLIADMAGRIALAGGEDRFVDMLDAFFGYGADAVKQLGVDPDRRDVDCRLRVASLRRLEQRTGHGGSLGLPLCRSTRPDDRDRACDRPSAVRAGPGWPAGQRRLGWAQFLVRVGLARAVPGCGAEPVLRQCAVIRAQRHPSRGHGVHDRHHRFRRTRRRPRAAVRPVRVAQRARTRPVLDQRQRTARWRRTRRRPRPGALGMGHDDASPVLIDSAPRSNDMIRLVSEAATRRLVIVVRADPVICGHSGEARNLAEVALTRGFDDVRIVTWPIDRLCEVGLPLKPIDSVLPYSTGITVERPAPVGDYKVPDGRYLAGITGRLVELFTDGTPTVAMSLYLTPHDTAISDAVRIARGTGLPVDVTTVAEAVGSDITNVVRSCVDEGNFGAAAAVLSTYLANDVCVAVSEFTKLLIVEAAEQIDERHGTRFAPMCRAKVAISYPAVHSAAYTELDPVATARVVAERELDVDGYVLFLSRLTKAKGVDDLIDGFAAADVPDTMMLVIAGNGPGADDMRAHAASVGLGDRIRFLHDVDDAEKSHLMAGSAAYVLASKPRPEFVETFGIALVEKMLAGGGPVITTATGGIPEAVGDAARIVPVADPAAIAEALEDVLVTMTASDRREAAVAARQHALQFDRETVFDRLADRIECARATSGHELAAAAS